jgi:putative FmdB family regulatory protein
MPSYDYRCECGECFERFFRMADVPEKSKCPKCGKKAGRSFTKPNIRISRRYIDNSPRVTRGRGY